LPSASVDPIAEKVDESGVRVSDKGYSLSDEL
jgi:hypothetical protein